MAKYTSNVVAKDSAKLNGEAEGGGGGGGLPSGGTAGQMLVKTATGAKWEDKQLPEVNESLARQQLVPMATEVWDFSVDPPQSEYGYGLVPPSIFKNRINEFIPNSPAIGNYGLRTGWGYDGIAALAFSDSYWSPLGMYAKPDIRYSDFNGTEQIQSSKFATGIYPMSDTGLRTPIESDGLYSEYVRAGLDTSFVFNGADTSLNWVLDELPEDKSVAYVYQVRVRAFPNSATPGVVGVYLLCDLQIRHNMGFGYEAVLRNWRICGEQTTMLGSHSGEFLVTADVNATDRSITITVHQPVLRSDVIATVYGTAIGTATKLDTNVELGVAVKVSTNHVTFYPGENTETAKGVQY